MMKRSISLVVIVAMLMMSAGIYQKTEAKAGGQLLTGILSKMQTAHHNLRSMRTGMVQQRHNPQIGSNETDYGTLIYKPGGKGKSKLRIDYTKPDQKSVSVIGEKFVFYQPRINQVLQSTLSKAAKGKTGSYSALVHHRQADTCGLSCAQPIVDLRHARRRAVLELKLWKSR